MISKPIKREENNVLTSYVYLKVREDLHQPFPFLTIPEMFTSLIFSVNASYVAHTLKKKKKKLPTSPYVSRIKVVELKELLIHVRMLIITD